MSNNRLRRMFYARYNISFSKSGDDLQIMKLITGLGAGTYVDVGSWHPIKASNSYFFYVRGWEGLCIDPNPELSDLYIRCRPTDSFVNCAIGNDSNSLSYYMLPDSQSSMNTLNVEFLKARHLESAVQRVVEVPVRSLANVLNEHLPTDKRFDFMDIDVEGSDLAVLKTNDWSIFQPEIVLVETSVAISEDVASETTEFMSDAGYRLVGKSNISGDLGNLFFLRQ